VLHVRQPSRTVGTSVTFTAAPLHIQVYTLLNEAARPENDVAETEAINESEAKAVKPACPTVITNCTYKFLLNPLTPTVTIWIQL